MLGTTNIKLYAVGNITEGGAITDSSLVLVYVKDVDG